MNAPLAPPRPRRPLIPDAKGEELLELRKDLRGEGTESLLGVSLEIVEELQRRASSALLVLEKRHSEHLPRPAGFGDAPGLPELNTHRAHLILLDTTHAALLESWRLAP